MLRTCTTHTRLSCAMVRSLARGRRHLSGLSFATWEKAQQAPATLNLAIGQPASSLLPMEAVQRAASALSSFDRRHVLQYGSIAGSHHYLDAVASFLTAELDEPHDASSLFATPGNSGGLALLTRVLTEPGDRVFIEDPSYFLAHGIFRDHGLSFVRLPQRATGTGTLDMDLVEQAFAQQAASSAPLPKVLYMVPTGNNPTGRSMPDEDRVRATAVEHARRSRVCDVLCCSGPLAAAWQAATLCGCPRLAVDDGPSPPCAGRRTSSVYVVRTASRSSRTTCTMCCSSGVCRARSVLRRACVASHRTADVAPRRVHTWQACIEQATHNALARAAAAARRECRLARFVVQAARAWLAPRMDRRRQPAAHRPRRRWRGIAQAIRTLSSHGHARSSDTLACIHPLMLWRGVRCSVLWQVVSGSLTSALVESLVAHLVTSGDAATHVHQLRASLARRATLLADAIEGEQPAGTPSLVHRATSGYFLWVDLRGLDAAELRERCVQAHGVAFLPGARCALDAAAAQARARVCFAFLEEDELVEAGRRLGRAIAEAHGTA
jgi:DNA-binding transcriptional MocR family regulator